MIRVFEKGALSSWEDMGLLPVFWEPDGDTVVSVLEPCAEMNSFTAPVRGVGRPTGVSGVSRPETPVLPPLESRLPRAAGRD